MKWIMEYFLLMSSDVTHTIASRVILERPISVLGEMDMMKVVDPLECTDIESVPMGTLHS